MQYIIRTCLLLSLFFVSHVHAQKLLRYSSFADHLEPDAYENQSVVDFVRDSLGIITGNKGYHPVRIGLYGLINIERYLATGDTANLNRAKRQTAYFRNDANLDYKFDGKGIALPYLFNYKQLKANWYSGMAQGLAISSLLRYSQATGDTSLYPKIRKMAYFMIQPESTGGTVSSSTTMGTWVEEYANSNGSRQVLNGSINGWIGLHEYCTFFPEDTAAAQVRDDALESLIASLEKFNLPAWCKYNQSGQQCSPSYLRCHVFQMRHMYEITGETKFLRQMRLWTMLLSGRKIEKNPGIFANEHFVFARPARSQGYGWYAPEYNLIPSLVNRGQTATSHSFTSKRAFRKFIKKGTPPPAVDSTSDTQMILVELSGPIDFDYVTFRYRSKMKAAPRIHLYAVNPKNGKTRELSIEAAALTKNYWHARLLDSLDQKDFSRIMILVEGEAAATVEKTQIGLYETKPIELPWFGFHKTEPRRLTQNQEYNISVPKSQTGEAMVFWRYGKTEKQAQATTFLPNNIVRDGKFTPKQNGYYQFAIIFDVENIMSTTGELRCEKQGLVTQ